MVAYGDDFPDFIAARICEVQEEPSLDYLPDVARLETAWVERPITPKTPCVATIDEIAAMSADQLPETRIAFHPAVRLLRFSHSGRLDLGVPSGRR